MYSKTTMCSSRWWPFRSLVWICELFVSTEAAAFHLTNSILSRWVERIGRRPWSQRDRAGTDRRSGRRTNGRRIEGEMGAQGHPALTTLLRSTLFAAEWLLSVYFYTPSINTPPRTHLCSLSKWHTAHMDTHNYRCRQWPQSHCESFLFLMPLYGRRVTFLQTLQITCCPAPWPALWSECSPAALALL